MTSSQRTAVSTALAAQTDARLDRLADEVRQLRDSVAGIARGGRPRGDDLKPFNDRIAAMGETIDRFRMDQGSKLGIAASALERIEKLDREMSGRISQMAERLERMERAAPTITGSIAAPAAATPAPAQGHAIPAPPPRPEAAPEKSAEAKPQPKQVEGWALRDIYGGVALIENRRIGMLEVARGEVVRGLGRIEKIERRNGRWVVVTQGGPNFS